jgi:hypothetical protein
MLNPDELKDLLPMLLGNVKALEQSVTATAVSLCERLKVKYLFWHLSDAGEIEVLASEDGKDATHRDKNGEIWPKGEFINALLGPGVGDMLNMFATSEEDKKGFFKFFDDILKESFSREKTTLLLFDLKNRFFCTSDHSGYKRVKITDFVSVSELLTKFAS